MDSIIRQVAGRLGIDPEMAASGAGSVMNLIKEETPPGDFQKFLKVLPEASDWMGQAFPAQVDGAEELVGELGGLLEGLSGSGTLAILLAALNRNGFSLEMAAQFLPTLLELIKRKAGPMSLEPLASSVPMLRDILGERSGKGPDLMAALFA